MITRRPAGPGGEIQCRLRGEASAADRAGPPPPARRSSLRPARDSGRACHAELRQVRRSLDGRVRTPTPPAHRPRREPSPPPVFLALGGALLAFLPGAPSFTLPPELALALFVAPVLLDAAYDASLRDLKDNWAPVTGLVVVRGRTHDRRRRRRRPHAHAGDALGAGDCARRRRRATRRRRRHRRCSASCDRRIAS